MISNFSKNRGEGSIHIFVAERSLLLGFCPFTWLGVRRKLRQWRALLSGREASPSVGVRSWPKRASWQASPNTGLGFAISEVSPCCLESYALTEAPWGAQGSSVTQKTQKYIADPSVVYYQKLSHGPDKEFRGCHSECSNHRSLFYFTFRKPMHVGEVQHSLFSIYE